MANGGLMRAGHSRAGAAWWAGLLCLASLLGGCSDEGSHRYANLPPDTFISYGPAQNGCNSYKIGAYWYGTDIDGSVKRFEVATVRGAALSALDSLELDALPWGATTSSESTFVVQADSCCKQAGRTWFDTATWGIFVRSVDDEGARDPEPAFTIFQACNQLPKVRVTAPIIGEGSPILCPRFPFRWTGSDPDGPTDSLAYKYIVIPDEDVVGGKWPPADGTPHPWLPPLDRDSSGVDHAAPPVGYWSEWVPADCTSVDDIDLTSYSGTGKRVALIVTARDQAGAILGEELYQTYSGNSNSRNVIIGRLPCSVPLVIDGGALGRRTSISPGEYQKTAYIYAGTEVKFTFWAQEDSRRGSLAADYRYYYDDPEDAGTSTWDTWTSVAPLRREGVSPEWYVKFPAGGPPQIPGLGSHILVVEIRDRNGIVTHCELRLEVLSGPRGKDRLIYLVNDDMAKFMEVQYAAYQDSTRAMWADILDGYNWEYFNTVKGSRFSNEVSPRRVGDATTVIWVVDQDIEGEETQLLNVCANLGNYLGSYVKVGGNLIIIGKDPVYATMYLPGGEIYKHDERSRYTALAFTPRHSYVDSAAIYSFMWEAFGIAEMRLGIPPVPFKTAEPCEEGWAPLTTGVIPGVAGWPGKMDNAFYITRVRTDIPVHKMYSMIPIDGEGNPAGPAQCDGANMRLVGVYVPGDGERGYAAYIGIPPWFFDHGQVKTMIRRLLEEFGEGQGMQP